MAEIINAFARRFALEWFMAYSSGLLKLLIHIVMEFQSYSTTNPT